MPPGGETELTLGAKVAEEALRASSGGAQELDWIIATSETITTTRRSPRNCTLDCWHAKTVVRWTWAAGVSDCSMRSLSPNP
jgi:hypothetical protein